MKVERLAIQDVLLLSPLRFGDARGFFSETFSAQRLAAAGIEGSFPQDNHSHSQAVGTLRGLHCQVAPHIQGRLASPPYSTAWQGFSGGCRVSC